MGPACQFLVKEKGQGGCIRAQRGWAGLEAHHLGLAQPGPRLGYVGWLKEVARRPARVRGSAYWAGRGWGPVFFFFFFFFLFSFSSWAALGRRGTGGPLPSFSSFLLHFPPRLTAWPRELASSPLTGVWGPLVTLHRIWCGRGLIWCGCSTCVCACARAHGTEQGGGVGDGRASSRCQRRWLLAATAAEI